MTYQASSSSTTTETRVVLGADTVARASKRLVEGEQNDFGRLVP